MQEFLHASRAAHQNMSNLQAHSCENERSEDKRDAISSDFENSMATTAIFVAIRRKDKKKTEEKAFSLQQKERPRHTVEVLEKKIYQFSDSDVPDMLDYLLEKKVIKFPQSKHL
ncbi:hypothetical protein ACH5RR_037160 [Cinchona calisaya]|uniref:Uncharacterized protein n=1 Tax=Cinchona calisaya TaxID=153742 RepID=A0ABD2Y6Q7_9GENT